MLKLFKIADSIVLPAIKAIRPRHTFHRNDQGRLFIHNEKNQLPSMSSQLLYADRAVRRILKLAAALDDYARVLEWFMVEPGEKPEYTWFKAVVVERLRTYLDSDIQMLVETTGEPHITYTHYFAYPG